jgi:tetratricopeptide (TPR) repeat protein
VKAIRHSEDADDFHTAGLLSRAIKMYKESLTYFADAYCIQSRLAVQLAEEGKVQEAEIHYRRAFELMPDSFGRMESHCFGCEGTFKGAKAGNIADKVFRELAAKTPHKPQVHYLLGYLREEQGRLTEALQHYKTAVKLDPLYINAWQHIRSLSERSALSPEDADAATFNLLKLDPHRRHADPVFRDISDLRKLWAAVEIARKSVLPPIPPLYPLPASRPLVEKLEKQMADQIAQYGGDFSRYMRMQGITPIAR